MSRGQDAGPEALRVMLDEGTVVAGACYDCISSRVLEDAGFACLTITGAGVAASRLGAPDIGLITHSEMIDVARRITMRAHVPVIADVDTGFGGVMNVTRTIEEFAAAGIAGAHIEDQVFPKRCGHLRDKAIVPEREFFAKIRAADRARQSTGMLLIARTDCIAVDGIDAAIDRSNRALDAGADVAFIEAPTSRAEIEAIAGRVQGRKLFNMVAGGLSPAMTFDELAELGYDIVILPPVALYPVIQAIRVMATAVLEARSDEPLRALGMDVVSFFEQFGLSHWLALDTLAENRD